MAYVPPLLVPGIDLAPQSVALVHVDAARSPHIYKRYRISSVRHLKEKTAIGHEFCLMEIVEEEEAEQDWPSGCLRRRETKPRLYRVERRPSTRNVRLSSSEALSDDTIAPVHSDAFRLEDYYHIFTVRCTDPPTPLSFLAFCQICKEVRSAAPMYSVIKATHCFWFCAAFIIQLKIEGYAENIAEGMHHWRKRKTFYGLIGTFIHDDIVEKKLRERTTPHIVHRFSQPRSLLSQGASWVRKSLRLAVGRANPPHTTNPYATNWREVGVLRGHQKAVLSLAFTCDNRIISGSRDTTVGVWDTTTGNSLTYLRGHKAEVTSVAVSPRRPSRGHQIVSGSCDNTIRIWDADALVVLRELNAHTQDIVSLCLSRDGSKIVSASEDKTLRLWDLDAETQSESDQPLNISLIPEAALTSVAWSNDGSLLAVGCSDSNNVQIWDATNPTTRLQTKASLEGHEWSITHLAFSPCEDSNYRVVSASRDATLRVWDGRTGQPIGEPFQGHTGSVGCVAWSHDGRYLASGSWDNSIRVWDVEEGLLLDILQGHVDDIDSVAFSPHGYNIVSGSTDKTMRMWSPAGPF